MMKPIQIYFMLLVVLFFQGICLAQLIKVAPKEASVKSDSLSVNLSGFSDTIKEFVFDSSTVMANQPKNEANLLLRMGICAASAFAYRPGGTPALCNIVPSLKR
ncbi:hypothetical protein B7993_09250 [Fibrobacter sp. UWH3]|nr:hypothetical protein B7993_09250 [Fibrobacter sp. UWH3]OWV16594.1 hypothetical protein B7992_02440 [Fibrobacter sp. UWH1]